MLKVLGTARNAGLVLFSVVLMEEHVSDVELTLPMGHSRSHTWTRVSVDEKPSPRTTSSSPPARPTVVLDKMAATWSVAPSMSA